MITDKEETSDLRVCPRCGSRLMYVEEFISNKNYHISLRTGRINKRPFETQTNILCNNSFIMCASQKNSISYNNCYWHISRNQLNFDNGMDKLYHDFYFHEDYYEE